MQAFLDNKRQKIVDDLIQIDRDLQYINFDNNECEARQLIDCRRQLLANLKSIKPVNRAAKFPDQFEYKPTTVSIERIKQSRSRVMYSRPEQHSFEVPFCNQILDSILPETWNFNSDVMVVSAPPSGTIISKATNRGQRHIVIYDHLDCIDEGAFSHHSTAKIVVCQTITDVEIALLASNTRRASHNCACSLDPKFLSETKVTWQRQYETAKKPYRQYNYRQQVRCIMVKRTF